MDLVYSVVKELFKTASLIIGAFAIVEAMFKNNNINLFTYSIINEIKL